jgi:hypothetical protein
MAALQGMTSTTAALPITPQGVVIESGVGPLDLLVQTTVTIPTRVVVETTITEIGKSVPHATHVIVNFHEKTYYSLS